MSGHPHAGPNAYDLSHRAVRDQIRREHRIEIAARTTCEGHSSPWRIFTQMHLERPALMLVLGPRGGGKSFLSGLDVHMQSRKNAGMQTRILGGSQAQSEQIYEAMRQIAGASRGGGGLRKLLREEASYANGSGVKILAASPTTVRGPHVVSLRLDEVDEIDPQIREAAMGMCMNLRGMSGSVVMTSTWHRLGGPISGLMDRATAGEFPHHVFCAFEILERCPDERSGPNLENCPDCPLFRWCHESASQREGVRPKAKLSDGHYAIDSLIQKVRSTSLRTFESDYLCRRPRAEGSWFAGFEASRHLTADAEYNPRLQVHLAIDPGVFTGAVFFQVDRGNPPVAGNESVRIFADYLSEGRTAEENAREILAVAQSRCRGQIDRIWSDPAGGSRTAIGPTVVAEYERCGLRPMNRWPVGSVADGLALVDSLLNPAEGLTRLTIHPRCGDTILAFQQYRRARRGGQWQDWPEDPQHPFEDIMDAVRGGLKGFFPQGRAGSSSWNKVKSNRVF